MNYDTLVQVLKGDGWVLENHASSGQMSFSHPYKPGIIEFHFESGESEIAPGTLDRILKKAGLK